MYMGFDPPAWRWIVLAAWMASFGAGLVLGAILGHPLQKRALARGRAERANRMPAHAQPVPANWVQRPLEVANR